MSRERPPAARPIARNDDWETEHAPKIGNLRLALPLLVFALWLAFLAWMSARRWFGALL